MAKQQKPWYEKAIEVVSPERALKRQQALTHLEILRSYDAAKTGRRNANWSASGTSANTEIYRSASMLRNRSRELCRNNPLVKRAVQSISNNSIGKGIQAKVSTSNKNYNKKVSQLWKDWFESTECDFDGHLSGYGLQKLVFRAVIESGDALIVRRYDTKKSVPLEIQVLEIDFLDTTKSSTSVKADGSYTFMGIEFNKNGKRTHYWLYDKHPGENINFTSLESKRVPAEDVIHVFEKLRPGQQVGVPFGVSAFMRAKDTDEYNDAQIMRQKIAACYAVFIKDSGASAAMTTSDIEEFERVEPGMMYRLGAEDEVTFASPPTTENFAEFNRTLVQHISAGFGTTYENITGDLSNVNFSSGRMGWIEHHRNVEDWQNNIMINMFCKRVFNWFIDAIQLKGHVPSGVSVYAGWTTPRREMIDPSKEVKGIQAMIRNMLISPSDAIMQNGYDPEEVLEETIEWNKKLDEAGIISDADPRKGKGGNGDVGRPADTGATAANSKDQVK